MRSSCWSQGRQPPRRRQAPPSWSARSTAVEGTPAPPTRTTSSSSSTAARRTSASRTGRCSTPRAAGTSWQRTNLTNVKLAAGQYYLVRRGRGHRRDHAAAGAGRARFDPDGRRRRQGRAGLQPGHAARRVPDGGRRRPRRLRLGTNCVEGAPTATLATRRPRCVVAAAASTPIRTAATSRSPPPTPRNTGATRNVCDSPTGTASADPERRVARAPARC